MNNQQRPGKTEAPARPAMGPMGRGNAMVLGGAKARDFNGTIQKLLGYLKSYWIQLIVAVVFAIASTVFV